MDFAETADHKRATDIKDRAQTQHS